MAACIYTTVTAQTQSQIMDRADSLIANKKYASAFKILNEYDEDNSKPMVVLLKEKIALNYYVSSLMHQIFAFKDLDKNEDVKDYRDKEGNFDSFTFPVNDILDTLVKYHPNYYTLYKGLGDYYYDVLELYGDKWLKTDSELATLVVKNYRVLIDHDLADYSIFYIAGLESLQLKRNKEAIPYLLRAIELKSDMPEAHYNLAYAYLLDNNLDNALTYATSAASLFQDTGYKSDATRMVGEIYFDKGDDSTAISYYESANRMDPGNYYNLKLLLDAYVKTGSSKAKETLDSFYHLAPDNPTIYNDLNDTYVHYKKSNDLIGYYLAQLPAYHKDDKITGTLNFYLGQLSLESDKREAKKYFIKARNIFSLIYDRSNEVFAAIDEGIQIAEKK